MNQKVWVLRETGTIESVFRKEGITVKRIVAWMLVCILMIGLLSAAVYAAGVPSPDEKVEIVTDPTVQSPQTGMNGGLFMVVIGMAACLFAASAAFKKSFAR